jgi:hypothetical protein
MAGSVPLDRLIGQPPILNYAANQQQVSQLDRTGLYDFIKMNVSYEVDVAAGASTAPFVGLSGFEAMLNLIQNVTLTATGNAAGSTTDTMINTDFITLAVYQYYYSNSCLPGAALTNLVPNSVQFPNPIVKLFFIDPWSNKGTMTRLDSRLLGQLNLSVSWRDGSAIGTGGEVTVPTGQMVLSVREWQNVPQTIRPWLRMSDRKFQIVSQQNAMQFQGVPIGNVIRREIYQGILIGAPGYNYGWSNSSVFASTGQAQGPMAQLLINNTIKVLNEPFNGIAGDDCQLLGLSNNAWSSTMNTGAAPGALPGWFVYEPARQKKVSQSLPMWGVNRADNYMDVAAPGSSGSYVKITDLELVGATAETLS